MPAPPSSAQTAARNAATRTNTSSGIRSATNPSNNGSSSARSSSSSSSSAARSSTSMASSASRSATNPSNNGSRSPSSNVGRAPAASAAAAKANSTSQSRSISRPASSGGGQNSSQTSRGPGASLAAASALSKVSPSARGLNAGPSKFGAGSSQSGGVSQSRSIQGMINSFTPEQNAARINAVSRGPGVISGALPGNTNATAQARNRLAQINSIAEDPAFNKRFSKADISNMTKTVIGEAAHEGPVGRAAVGNSMFNRLSLGIADPDTYGYLGGGKVGQPGRNPTGLMAGYDAAGVNRPGAKFGPNAGFRNTVLGTEAYSDGLRALADARSPYSEFGQTASPRVMASTHYYNPSISDPRWGTRSGNQFDTVGNHVFGNAEPGTAGQVAAIKSYGLSGLSTAVADRAPIPRPVPRPPSQNMQTPEGWAKAPLTAPPIPRPRPPSQNMQTPPGWTPSAPEAPEPETPPGYFKQFAMTPEDMERLKQDAMKDFSFRELMEMRKNQEMLPGFMGPITRDMERSPAQTADAAPPPVPRMRPPSQNMQRPVGGMSFTPGLPGQMPVSQNMLPPPGWQPPAKENLGPPESYVDPSTGVSRNPFDTQRGIPGAGMSFTPGLPGPQKQDYSRIAQTPGPQQPYQLPSYPGQAAAGTYTAPYDVPNRQAAGTYTEPYNVRGPALKGMDKLTELPPGYAERYLQAPDSPQEQPEYSDNPMQGPSNPSQEEENPQVVEERRDKYSKTGATVGGVIAGPVGAVVGGILGDQMGKTPTRVKQQIAGSPQALRANVMSINGMFGADGGRNPEHRVTERGLRDVLINPDAVLEDPESYTTLEEMLAALSKGIDPATGKPI